MMFNAVRRSKALRRLAWRVGRQLYMDARGEQLTYEIRQNGESFLQASVLKAVPQSENLSILDIGANRGEWTFSLLEQMTTDYRTAHNYRIDLFEPVPSTADVLERLLSSALDPALHLHRFALSDQAGEIDMAIMSESGGTNSIHFDGSAAAPPGGWVRVKRRTVAEFCREESIEHVHLAKCDAEGHDSTVLAGARSMLEQERIDVFQFEYNHRWVFSRSFLRDVFRLVEGLPYLIARVDTDRLEVFDKWHEELERYFQSNYALIHRRALAWFPSEAGAFDISNTFVRNGR